MKGRPRTARTRRRPGPVTLHRPRQPLAAAAGAARWTDLDRITAGKEQTKEERERKISPEPARGLALVN